MFSYLGKCRNRETSYQHNLFNPSQKTNEFGSKNRKMIKAMYYDPKNPSREVRERYRRCIVGYDDALKSLQQGKILIMNRYRPPYSVNHFTLSAMEQIDSCDKSFNKTTPQPVTLKHANNEFKALCSIIIAISNFCTSRLARYYILILYYFC